MRVTDARCPPVDASPVHWSPWQWNWFTGGTPLWLIWQSLKWEVCQEPVAMFLLVLFAVTRYVMHQREISHICVNDPSAPECQR